jgi:cell division control protein 24
MDITPSTTPPLVVNGISLTTGAILNKSSSQLPQTFQQPPPRSAPSIAQSTITTASTASNSTVSLYQTCIALRDRLQGVPGFQHFLELTEKPNSTDSASDTDHLDTLDLDVVSHLWRCFMLGPSLCCIYNAMNPAKPLDVNYDCTLADLKECKKAVYHFLVAIRGIVAESKLFTISDLYNNNTNGIVKVRGV